VKVRCFKGKWETAAECTCMSCSWLKIEMRCAAGRRNEPLYAGVEGTGGGTYRGVLVHNVNDGDVRVDITQMFGAGKKQLFLHCVFDNATWSK
jgi:hypothetical protein